MYVIYVPFKSPWDLTSAFASAWPLRFEVGLVQSLDGLDIHSRTTRVYGIAGYIWVMFGHVGKDIRHSHSWQG